MLGSIFAVRLPPQWTTVPDQTFRAVEDNGLFPLFDSNGSQVWIRRDDDVLWIDPSDVRMPDIDLLVGPANRWQTLFALLVNTQPPSKKLLPPIKSGLMAVFNPGGYTNLANTIGDPRFYMFYSTRLIVRHEDGPEGDKGKRHDSAQTFCDLNGLRETGRANVPIMFEPKTIQGGDVSAVSTFSAFYLTFAAARYAFRIGGKNPKKRQIRAEIQAQATRAGLGNRVYDLWAIAYTESLFTQFEDPNDKLRPGFPFRGRLKGNSTDWGIMQLTVVPYDDAAAEGYRPFHSSQQELSGSVPVRLWPPPSKQLWDWRANIAGGIRTYAAKASAATRHKAALEALARSQGTEATLPTSAWQLETFQRYNSNLMYWSGWNNQTRSWIPNPACASPADYGNKVMRILSAITKANGYPAESDLPWGQWYDLDDPRRH